MALYSENDSETIQVGPGNWTGKKEGVKDRQTQRHSYRRVAMIWFMVALMEHHQGMQNLMGVMIYSLYLYRNQRKALPTPSSRPKEDFANSHGSESLDRHLITIHIQ